MKDLLITIYGVGSSIAFLFFNYAYISSHSFGEWLFFGGIVPTVYAVLWPLFVLAKVLS